MKKVTRKLLTLMAVMLIAMVCLSFSASAETQGYYTYTVIDDEATITKVDTSISGEIIIPDTLDGYPVTVIGNLAFLNAQNITKVTIPDSVTIIEEGAFRQCYNLYSVEKGNNIISIGDEAFLNCYDLYSITIGDYVEYIGKNAFNCCFNLSSITIPSGVEVIKETTFYGCSNLSNVTISDGVTTIEGGAFMYCITLGDIILPDSVTSLAGTAFSSAGITSLTIGKGLKEIVGTRTFNEYTCLAKIQVEPNNLYFSSKDGVLFNKDKTELICYPNREMDRSYTIPGTVKAIADRAFESSENLTEIIIPDSVETVGTRAFDGCKNIKSIKLGTGLKSAGLSAFDTGVEDIHFGGTSEQWNEIYLSADLSRFYFGKIVHMSADNDKNGYCDECGYAIVHTHSYNSVVTPPTCTAEGYTTYTCSCGDNYIADYVETLAHSHVTEVTPPTCTSQGYTTYSCSCGDSYVSDYMVATGHSDNNSDGSCDSCGIKISADTADCSCNCHKGGFMGFIWKILRFFYKLFGMNKTCSCGVAHY